MLEQPIVDKYKPSLTSANKDVIYFNFKTPENKDFIIKSSSKKYLVYDYTIINILCEADSYN